MSHNGSSETSSFIDECWASWFCNLSGNQFFCEIDKAYMEDSFNLFGLKQHVSKDYSKALDTILDRLGIWINEICLKNNNTTSPTYAVDVDCLIISTEWNTTCLIYWTSTDSYVSLIEQYFF